VTAQATVADTLAAIWHIESARVIAAVAGAVVAVSRRLVAQETRHSLYPS
jgi:hypothetical protein